MLRIVCHSFLGVKTILLFVTHRWHIQVELLRLLENIYIYAGRDTTHCVAKVKQSRGTPDKAIVYQHELTYCREHTSENK
jgi:hypothetical protein